MKKSVVLSLLLLMCIGIGAQRVQKMSHDIRLLVDQTTSQVLRTPSVKQHETVRAMIRFNGSAEAVMGEYGCNTVAKLSHTLATFT